MSCYYPLKGYDFGVNSMTGKKIIKVLPYGSDPLPGKEVIPIPCGRCIGCRLDYSKEWANRCLLEMQYHERNCFVTLTYDDFHVPHSRFVSPDDGCLVDVLSLRSRDFQLFIKRLRKHFSDLGIRFFGCGEYGDDTLRPHYHVVLFGVDFDDKEFLKKSTTGFDIFSSPTLTRLWSFPSSRDEGSHTPVTPAGIATVQACTYETCAYTARYVMKKLKGQESEFYKEMHIEPPFVRMSRRPGLGRQYYDDHPDLYNRSSIHVSTLDGGKSFQPPKYFDRLLQDDDPELYEVTKYVRKFSADQSQQARLANTDLDYLGYLNLCNENLQSKIKSLKRSGA